MAKVSITGELEKIERSYICKQHLFYPILFQEDLYGIAYNRFMDETESRKNKSLGFNDEFNFLALKRLIKKLRQSNYSWISSDPFFKKFRIVQEILIIIFNSILTIGSESVTGKTTEWNGNQSIHSTFSFVEDKIHNSIICSDITIPYFFHPEIPIRTFRQHISDTSFLHFFRLLIHQNKQHIGISNPRFYSRKNQFYNLLWNSQVHKFEYSLIHICKQIYNFQSTLFWFFIDRNNFAQKIGYLCKQLDLGPMEEIIQKNCSIYYVRYQNNLVISANANFNLFFKNWNLFFLIFRERYFHFWVEPHRINIKDLSKNPLRFLGYLSRIKNKSTLIRIQLVNNSIDTNLIFKELCSDVPIIQLIGLLAKEKFCDTLGRPICRVSWTTLTDHEIFRRFDQIIKNIFCYYSGCIRKKALYQLQYILRFSRAKTLACKHKSTIRTVWKKYGSNFVTNSVSLKKPRSNSWRTYEKKFRYLNIIQINHLANLSQKLNNV
uniref:Maturase K n=1 Tax=Bazzania praerupta TaxID=2575587 RepID=A0A4Y5P6W6_9MARC|nr:maturase K [Bazzania praerupta]QCW59060.1 maturase K [Bazzania praerupta]